MSVWLERFFGPIPATPILIHHEGDFCDLKSESKREEMWRAILLH
jgi:hypothetical protein